MLVAGFKGLYLTLRQVLKGRARSRGMFAAFDPQDHGRGLVTAPSEADV